MDNYEKFNFILCLCVFLILTIFIGSLLVYIHRLSIKLIDSGVEDSKIKDEYLKETSKSKKRKTVEYYFNLFFSGVISLVLVGFFAFSLIVKYAPDSLCGEYTQIYVVESGSMAKKYEGNTYLYENNLDNQFQMFDIIISHKLPAEDELQLYDIVIYEFEDVSVIHRIIGIEEPNESHPDCRYFLLKGDANENNDRFPVLYSQMVGVYRNERIPFIGSFVLFLQSPAGYLCILLMIFTMIVVPIAERKLDKHKSLRLSNIKAIDVESSGDKHE